MTIIKHKLTQSKYLVMSQDLNGAHKLFGGKILSWIDEQAYIAAIMALDGDNVVTKLISTVNFISGANLGEIVEVSTELVALGKTSITFKSVVRNLSQDREIACVDKIVMVNVDASGKPAEHGLRLDCFV